MTSSESDLRLRTPRAQHWYPITIGRSYFVISLTTNTQAKRLGCELYIRGTTAKLAFSQLNEDKEGIEGALGKLDWQDLPHSRDCRIVQYRDGDSKKKTDWPELHAWLKERAEAFHKELGPRVKALKLDAPEANWLRGLELSDWKAASPAVHPLDFPSIRMASAERRSSRVATPAWRAARCAEFSTRRPRSLENWGRRFPRPKPSRIKGLVVGPPGLEPGSGRRKSSRRTGS